MMRCHARLILLVILSVFSVMSLTVVASAAPTSQDARYATPVVVVNTSFLNIRTGPGIQYSVLITVVGGTTLPVLGIAPDGVWFQVSTQAGVGWLNSQYGLPRGNFQYVPVVKAPVVTQSSTPPTFTGGAGFEDNAADVGFSSGRVWGLSVLVGHDLRTTAGIAGKSVGFVDKNDVVYAVTNAAFVDGVAWVQINVQGIGLGWVEQSKSIYRPYGCGFSVVQMTQNRDLAVGPDGSGGDKDKSIAAGQEAYLLDVVGNLYKIELMSGGIGWVDNMAITIRDETKTIKPPCVSAATISSGTGNSTEGTGGAGSTTSTQPAFAGAYVVINTGYLNIRSGAGAQYSTVASVPGGTRLGAVGFAPDGVWILVSGDFGRGWVNGDYVLFRGDARSLPVIRETSGQTALPIAQLTRTITLYAAPNLTLGVVGTLNAPAEYTVIGRTADSLWVQLTSPVGIGWVQADFVIVKGNTAQIPVIGN
jgi:uncharacterized protein YraI